MSAGCPRAPARRRCAEGHRSHSPKWLGSPTPFSAGGALTRTAPPGVHRVRRPRAGGRRPVTDLTQLGQVPELGHQEPGHRLVGAFGQDDPCLLGKIVGIQQPVDDDVTAAEADAGRRPSRSYSSRMSPTTSSTRSSSVTMPAVPPYSSTTIARCSSLATHLRQRGEHVLAVGQHLDRPERGRRHANGSRVDFGTRR